MKKTLAALFALSVTATLFSQPKSKLLEFAQGPAQWIMTREEQQAWKRVKTEEQAREFIDLFWARRDPTPGTPKNENRIDFDGRVLFADNHFAEKQRNRRGSLTERGRTIIVLGFPKEFDIEGMKTTRQLDTASSGFNGEDPTGGRVQAQKDTWTYSHDQAAKFGVPRLEVVFFYDGFLDAVRRDPQRSDFTMALPKAIQSYIVSPDLTTVPEWASSKLFDESGAHGPQQHIETTTSYDTVTKTTYVDGPAPIALPAGAGKLTLLEDTMSLQPQSGTDPLAAAPNVSLFRRDREMGWAAEYCSGQILDSAPAVTVEVAFTSPNGDRFATDPEEFVPDSIKASPGCYLLRGAMPLSELDPGAYKVTVKIIGPSQGQRYNLSRDFRVQ
jgi:GWxTD domain-containing protein